MPTIKGYKHKVTTQITKEIEYFPPKCKRIFILGKKEVLDNIYKHPVRWKNKITKANAILIDEFGKKHKTIVMVTFCIKTNKTILKNSSKIQSIKYLLLMQLLNQK